MQDGDGHRFAEVELAVNALKLLVDPAVKLGGWSVDHNFELPFLRADQAHLRDFGDAPDEQLLRHLRTTADMSHQVKTHHGKDDNPERANLRIREVQANARQAQTGRQPNVL